MASITLSDDVYFTTAPTSDISTTAISNSENYITVRVTQRLFETVIQNQPIIIPSPIPAQQQPSSNASDPLKPTEDEVDNANVVFIIDLFRINSIFNVQGVLFEEQGGDTGLTKANNLKILSKYGGTIQMVHRGTDAATQKLVEGIITKLSIREQNTGRNTDENAVGAGSPIAYEVQMFFFKIIPSLSKTFSTDTELFKFFFNFRQPFYKFCKSCVRKNFTLINKSTNAILYCIKQTVNPI